MPTRYDWTPRSRFMDGLEQVYMEPNTGCWLWPWALTDKGYGTVHFDGKRTLAHRVSYRYHFGDIPHGMSVLHKCDVRCCINPRHLYLGTQADNMADVARRERSPKASITTEVAIKILLDDRKEAEIMKEFGVGRQVVRALRRGVTYPNAQRAVR